VLQYPTVYFWFIIILGILILMVVCVREVCKQVRGQTKTQSSPRQYSMSSTRGIAPEIQLAMCTNCEATILAHASVCPHCHQPRPVCMVCKFYFPQNAPALACPHCGGIAHRVHFLEHLKVKGTCPNCRQSLDSHDLVEQRVGTTSQQPSLVPLQFSCIVCHHNLHAADSILQCPECEGRAHRVHFLEYLKVKGKCPQCHAELDKHKLLVKKNLDSTEPPVE
jgi:Zn finger protein HypA/HybF involved in hydrogenase expression